MFRSGYNPRETAVMLQQLEPDPADNAAKAPHVGLLALFDGGLSVRLIAR